MNFDPQFLESGKPDLGGFMCNYCVCWYKALSQAKKTHYLDFRYNRSDSALISRETQLERELLDAIRSSKIEDIQNLAQDSLKRLQVSISSTFYEQFLRTQISKAQKDNDNLT